jgi:hypothetical protein
MQCFIFLRYNRFEKALLRPKLLQHRAMALLKTSPSTAIDGLAGVGGEHSARLSRRLVARISLPFNPVTRVRALSDDLRSG